MHQWNTQEQETFQFMAAVFDVRAAKQILADRAEAGKAHKVVKRTRWVRSRLPMSRVGSVSQASS